MPQENEGLTSKLQKTAIYDKLELAGGYRAKEFIFPRGTTRYDHSGTVEY